MIILSLIIPNYNGILFLESCITSVTSQLLDNVEVIFIDDGSTDNSVNFINNKFLNYIILGRIKIISTSNQGPGHARNVGIINSTGQYIAFLDSDDYLLPNYFNTIINIIHRHSPDIIQFNELRVLNDDIQNSSLLFSHISPESLYPIDEVINEIFGIGKWFSHSRVFKRNFISENLFPNEKIFYEDLFTIPFIFFNIKNIYLIDKPLLAYRNNPYSITNNHKIDDLSVLLLILKRSLELPSSNARDLLTINVARSVLHFFIEFNIKHISIKTIIDPINLIYDKFHLLKHLHFPSIFFLLLPNIYYFLNFIRINLFKLKKYYVLK